MWQRFTERARRVVFFAQEDAGRLGENNVSTEHLLLGLVRENDNVAARILDRLGVSCQQVRSEIERQVTRGSRMVGNEMQLTPRAKRVIDLAYDEARGLNNEYIGTEHLLLGLIREGEGLAGRILAALNVSHDRVMGIVKQLPSEHGSRADAVERSSFQVNDLRGRDLVAIADLSTEDLRAIFAMTRKLKSKQISAADQRKILEGKTLAMIFEKPSLRTRLTFELAEVKHSFHNAIAGQPLLLQLPAATQPVGIEVVPPDGETLRLKSEGAEGHLGQTFRYADTHAIGVYLLRVLGTTRPEQTSYAVNVDPDEADPAKVGRQELQERFGHTPLVFAENPDDLSSTFAWLREGKSLWTPFLAVVLMGLVFETFLSNRLSPKQEETTAQQPPPGMRRLAKKGA